MFVQFLKTIFLVDLFQGLWVTLKYFFRRKLTI
jgi:formate hydrogenlyase subunit 6/NADH:ubiquinone oxidoreductase subunit I